MRALSERGQEWAKVVAEQATSGQTVKAFCRDRGVSEAGFYYWRRELQQRAAQPAAIPGAPSSPPSAGFVAVVPVAATQVAPASMAVVAAGRPARAVPSRLVVPTSGCSGVVVQVDERLHIRLTPGFDRATLVAALAAVSEVGACWR